MCGQPSFCPKDSVLGFMRGSKCCVFELESMHRSSKSHGRRCNNLLVIIIVTFAVFVLFGCVVGNGVILARAWKSFKM